MWIDGRTETYIDKRTDIQTNRLYKWMNGFDRGRTDRQRQRQGQAGRQTDRDKHGLADPVEHT
jgi:hypothetical protein